MMFHLLINSHQFSKMVDTLKDDATQSYIVGFKTTLQQLALVHPHGGLLRVEPMQDVC